MSASKCGRECPARARGAILALLVLIFLSRHLAFAQAPKPSGTGIPVRYTNVRQAAGITFLVGAGVSAMQTIGTPVAFTSIVFLVGLALLPLAEETKDKELPA